MPSYEQIERFTLAFHRRAIARLREQPELRDRALAVLDRWEEQGMSAAGQVYRDRWRELLAAPLPALEAAVCTTTSDAATLRSMSPLGFVLDDTERQELRRAAMLA